MTDDLTYALAASPNYAQDGACFAARRSGLYRSVDGGSTWQDAYASLGLVAPLATMAVAVAPGPGAPGTGAMGDVFAGVAGGVLRSPDGGHSWLTTPLPSPPPVVSGLAVSPDYARDGTVLAATVEDGVFRSGDRGSRWELWNFGLLDLDVYCIALSPAFGGPLASSGLASSGLGSGGDETLYVGTETGIFRSTNEGRAWREVDFALDLAPVLSLALSPDYARDGCLYAGTESHGLYHSEDRGRTWERIGETSPLLAGVPAQSVSALLLSPDYPAKPQILAMLADALIVSRDGGTTWEAWQMGLDLGPGAACVTAPLGLDPGAPLLVGLLDGRVLRV
jgi:photosystem II stability/assembly factor-like uncharacterized protein